jgi:hypothetical protein
MEKAVESLGKAVRMKDLGDLGFGPLAPGDIGFGPLASGQGSYLWKCSQCGGQTVREERESSIVV